MKNYKIVGHRGWPEQYPENTLVGALAALRAGVDALELDVQFSIDGVALVIHDDNLRRTAGIDKSILDSSYTEMLKTSVHEALRFGTQHWPTPLSTLREYCEGVATLLRTEQKVFVEIKAESIAKQGIDYCLQQALQESDAIAEQRVLISFDYDFIQRALTTGNVDCGWILEVCDSENLAKALKLAPQYLVTDWKKIPSSWDLKSHPCRWFVYDIVANTLAAEWAARGVEFIETWDCNALI